MKRTPLYEIHQQLGARMVDFGGWELPVSYRGIREEHRAVRETVGLFDISHMGELILSGPAARSAVQFLTCNDLHKLKAGQCQYSALLTEQGTFVDDIIVYPLGDETILLCVNAGNTDKAEAWIKKHLTGGVKLYNESARWCQLALQGPLAQATLQPLVSIDLDQLRRFNFCETSVAGVSVLLSRTGYTGEDGFEIYGPAGDAPTLWETCLDAGTVEPCGLGARDTLRLEAALPLYGHEIDDTINPYEAGLAWIVKLEKGDFLGQAALKAIKSQALRRRLVGLKMQERAIPRQGYTVWDNDRQVGEVRSGTLSPTLDCGIATAYVESEAAAANNVFTVDIRGKKRKAGLVALPFVKKS